MLPLIAFFYQKLSFLCFPKLFDTSILFVGEFGVVTLKKISVVQGMASVVHRLFGSSFLKIKPEKTLFEVVQLLPKSGIGAKVVHKKWINESRRDCYYTLTHISMNSVSFCIFMG
jgi:hypothetical protein